MVWQQCKSEGGQNKYTWISEEKVKYYSRRIIENTAIDYDNQNLLG